MSDWYEFAKSVFPNSRSLTPEEEREYNERITQHYELVKCPHGEIIYHYDYRSWLESEAEDGDHMQPLPPYCRCCGGPCQLGHTHCETCK